MANADSLGHLDESRPAVDPGAERDEVVGNDTNADRVAVAGDGRAGAGVVYLADLGVEGVADEASVSLRGVLKGENGFVVAVGRHGGGRSATLLDVDFLHVAAALF